LSSGIREEGRDGSTLQVAPQARGVAPTRLLAILSPGQLHAEIRTLYPQQQTDTLPLPTGE